MQHQKIRFEHKAQAPFYRELKEEVSKHLADHGQTRYADRGFWIKSAINLAVVVGSYGFLVSGVTTNRLALLAAVVTFGLSGLLLMFNVAHDAVHGTLSPKNWINHLAYRLSFIPVGINGHLWAMRHLHSHHVFTNVNGSDIDIDENPFLRLSPNHARRWYQRWQHLYAPLVYVIGLPHTIFVQDFIYLSKKQLGNLTDIKHAWYEYVLFFAGKAVYCTLMFAIPMLTIDLPAWEILAGYMIMATSISVLFIVTLGGTHFSEDAAFPNPDDAGVLGGCWALHVLRTSLDWNPESKLTVAVFGGANAHVAHHLFPSTCHVHYAQITPMIRAAAQRHGLVYRETTFGKMVASHYGHLKAMAADEPQVSFDDTSLAGA